MSSIGTQFPEFGTHHAPYPAIDPRGALKGSAQDKVVFISGGSRGICRATAYALHAYLVDEPELAAGFAVWLCSGAADLARGRNLGATWDVGELEAQREAILRDDLLVNRLRTGP